MQLIRIAIASLALLAAADTTAHAYPQFQFSTGNVTCGDCHFSPVGGGLINDWGRDEAADTISRGGSGKLLHGLWDAPEWFKLGGDYRGAVIGKEVQDQSELLAFPMQLDLYTRFKVGPVSLNTTLGARGVARGDTSVTSRLISREHFLMYQNGQNEPYVRVGRFFAPFGLRLQDHTAYTRRFTGYHTLEENYGVSGGYFGDSYEAHLSAFTGAPLFGVGEGNATGGAFYYERRILDSTAAFGSQARVAFRDGSARYLVGGVGKLWLEDSKLLLLGEANVGLQTFDDPGPSRVQTTGYLGATYFLTTGLMLGTSIQHFDEDLELSATARNAWEVTVQFFPRAHFEFMLLGKLETQGDFGDPSSLAMFMWHYYL